MPLLSHPSTMDTIIQSFVSCNSVYIQLDIYLFVVKNMMQMKTKLIVRFLNVWNISVVYFSNCWLLILHHLCNCCQYFADYNFLLSLLLLSLSQLLIVVCLCCLWYCGFLYFAFWSWPCNCLHHHYYCHFPSCWFWLLIIVLWSLLIMQLTMPMLLFLLHKLWKC